MSDSSSPNSDVGGRRMTPMGHTKPPVPERSGHLDRRRGRDSVAGMSAARVPTRFRGPVLPDGEVRDLYVVDGVVSDEPQSGRRGGGRGLDRAGPRRCPLPRRARRERRRRRGDHRGAGDRRPRRRRPAAARLRVGGRHGLGARARGPPTTDPRRPAHRPDEALHPQLRPRGRARRAPGVRRPGGAARRRLGQAGRRLDRPGDRRPRAVVPRGGVRGGDRHGARARREGHRPLLRRGRAAGPDRRRDRLPRARHRPVDGPDRRDGRPRGRPGADGDAAEQLPGVRRLRTREVPGVRPPHARPARATPRHDHGGPRGGGRDLRRHRRRRRAAPRPGRGGGARARRLRLLRRGRPRCRVLAGARVARPRRPARRGDQRRLRGLRPQPARGPQRAGGAEADRAAWQRRGDGA